MEQLTTLQKLNRLMEVECKSKSTIRTYERHIEKFVKYYGEEPDQERIIDYLYYLKTKKNYDKSSLNVVLSALKYYYKEILDQEITTNLPKIKRRKSIPKPLSKSIIKKIIENIKNFKHRLLVELAYDGGFRPEEAVSLKWEDVDWDNNSIMINRGKGDKDRPSYISKRVMQHLKDYNELRKNKDCKYIFDSEYKPDYHICKRTFEEIIKKIAKKLGIETRVYPYRLRHSFGSHLKESGEPVEDIQPRMGHSSIKTTLGYVRVAKPREDMRSPMDDPYFKDNGVTRNIV